MIAFLFVDNGSTIVYNDVDRIGGVLLEYIVLIVKLAIWFIGLIAWILFWTIALFLFVLHIDRINDFLHIKRRIK